MNEYIRSILLTVAGCHLLLLVTTELGGTASRKILRFLCGIILLLTIFHPLQNCAEAFQQAMSDLLTVPAEDPFPEEEQISAVSESTYAYIAERWITYLAEEYAIPREEIRVIFHTDTDHTLMHAEIELKNCYYTKRQAIEDDMKAQTDLPLTVKGW